MDLFLASAFLPLPGEADRSGFNFECSLLVIAIVYILLLYYYVACPCDQALCLDDSLSPQSVYCLTLCKVGALFLGSSARPHCL